MQTRQRFVSDQRFDLPQYDSMVGYIDAEFNSYNRSFFAPLNYIVKNWMIESIGGLTIKVNQSSDSVLFNTERTGKETLIAHPAISETLSISLADNATNYVEIKIVTRTGAPDTVAIWDSTANSGNGEEFTQTVDTAYKECPTLVSNTITFSGSPDRLPLAVVITSGGVVVDIIDSRNLLFHLDMDWNFGSTSESRTDKSIGNHKESFDAITTAIKELKGLSKWYGTPWSSLKTLREYQNLFFSNGGVVSWGVGGTDTLRFTDQILINVAGRDTTYTLGIVGNNDYVLADGSCLYVEIPETGTVATATVSPIGLVPIDPLTSGQNQRTMVLFFRKFGTILGLMDLPELSVGETATIGMDLPSAIRGRLGIISDKEYVPYNSLNSISENDDYASAISKIDHKVMLLLNDSPQEQTTVMSSLTAANAEISINTSVGWVADNTIPDLQVFRNGQKLIASSTSLSTDGDYVKTAYPTIKFFYDIPSNSKITFRNEKSLLEYTAKRGRFISNVTGISGTNVLVGLPFNPVSGKLHVYRNGVRILPAFTVDQFGALATLTGDPYMKYMESNSTAITLDYPATGEEVFTFVNQSVSHLCRTAYSSITAATLVLSFVATNTYLRVWKNGILMVENSTNGIPSSQDTYTLSISTIAFNVAPLATDLFLIESLGFGVGRREDKTGMTGKVITLSTPYVVGSDKLLVFKNGILLYRSTSLGDTDDRYVETSTNSITLGAVCSASDIFSFIQEEV